MAESILREIVEVNERMYGRLESLARTEPRAISAQDLDEAKLKLLEARLQLALYLKEKP